ncbi:VapE domain-containing protein [Nostoc sp. 'Peltigera membranacea cyanobiont' N6]|uniref:VapE domain-containing protein n=1 Tax=Nostoc sp. 'Peltigera membranacea cyanobiont' N6 TaxID=1261031 RepID=UPI000CF34948|nr:VapE domain-containing protein [Nostoc sp. 'Peltigera membranacea cyanobiont' N6]AVH65601.1 virulence-associated E family protein [Nostoc sp. 'Peltigera membranacea cyanobiont' N6]
MSHFNSDTSNKSTFGGFNDDDSAPKADQVLKMLRAVNILDLADNKPGSSRFDNKDYHDQVQAKRAAVKFIENAKDKPQAFWQVFEAVYGWIKYDEWLQKYHLNGAEISFNKLMCELENVLEISRKGQSEFLSSRRRDFQERKAFNPVKEYLQKVALKYPVIDADDEVISIDALEAIIDEPQSDYVPVHPQVMPEWGQLAKILFGVDDALSQKMLECWLRGAVARAVNPGCKMDNVLILKSAQGKAKTTFFEILGDAYFIQSSDPTSVETTRLLQKGWICELGELEGITRKSDVELFKHFITKRKDDLRVMHTEDIPERPRHVVFGGTCNSNEILKDTTGNRRFMVVPVIQKIPAKWLKENRDRIWASAYHSYMFYKNHENSHDLEWWFTDEIENIENTRYP